MQNLSAIPRKLVNCNLTLAYYVYRNNTFYYWLWDFFFIGYHTILLKVASAKYHNYCRRLFLLLVVLITHFSALRGYSIWGIWSQISIICTCIFSYLSIWPLALTATHETMTHRPAAAAAITLHFRASLSSSLVLSRLVSDQSQWPVIYSVKCIEEEEDESPLRKNKIIRKWTFGIPFFC